jgi:predicted RNA binding protein YcfA (HicA-like mRNA interferase family)
VIVPRIPGVNHLDAVRALEKAGFQVVRQGKHIVMSDGVRQVTIPRHNPIKAFTMGGIVADAGLTVEEFRRLM